MTNLADRLEDLEVRHDELLDRLKDLDESVGKILSEWVNSKNKDKDREKYTDAD